MHDPRERGLNRSENRVLFLGRRGCLLVAIAFLVKLAFASYVAELVRCSAPSRMLGRVAVAAGDTPSYLEPIDTFIATGDYAFWNGRESVRAGRMPHYGLIYYVLRLLAPRAVAYDLLVLAQLAAEAMASVALASLCGRLCGGALASWLGYCISVLSLHSLVWSIHLVPESFSVSFLVFFLFFYQRYLDDQDLRWLAAAGLAFGLTVVLKPYLAPCLVFVAWELVANGLRRGHRLRAIVGRIMIAGGSLGFLLMPWMARNYVVLKRVVPFQADIYAGYAYTKADLAFRRFAQSWGGSIVFWDKRSAGCYFVPTDLPCEYQLPAHALSRGYTAEDVESVRRQYIVLQGRYSRPLDDQVAARFDQFASIYKSERRLAYIFMSPVRLAGQLVLHSGSYHLPISGRFPCFSTLQLTVKVAHSGLYYVLLSAGSVGLLYLTRHGASVLFALIPAYIIVLFAWVIRVPEARYFDQAYPILILGLTCTATRLLHLRRLK